MLAGGGLADVELFRDEHAAHAVLNQIAIDLRREVLPWILQPGENLQPSCAGKRGKRRFEIHIDT